MKKKKVMPKRWAKPSKDERDTFYGTLESVEILHCGVCFKQDDMESSDIVEWIQCSTCDIWVHNSCVDASTKLMTSFVVVVHVKFFCDVIKLH